jgi:hypothetical protein
MSTVFQQYQVALAIAAALSAETLTASCFVIRIRVGIKTFAGSHVLIAKTV